MSLGGVSPAKTNGYLSFLTIALVVLVAIMCVPTCAEWRLMAGAAPDALASANAFNESPAFPVLP